MNKEPGWIMLRCKLPVDLSPPKMSIHWSEMWADMVIFQRTVKHNVEYQRLFALDRLEKFSEDDDVFPDSVSGMNVPNFARARKIIYKGSQIRVFPHECTFISDFKKFAEAYDLVAGDTAGEMLMDRHLTKGQRFVFDAALVDGCDEYQAMLVAMGKEVNDVPAPVGWFRLKEDYANYFCYAEEQEE